MLKICSISISNEIIFSCLGEKFSLRVNCAIPRELQKSRIFYIVDNLIQYYVSLRILVIFMKWKLRINSIVNQFSYEIFTYHKKEDIKKREKDDPFFY